jgi:hypothetical protein
MGKRPLVRIRLEDVIEFEENNLMSINRGKNHG